MERIIKRPLPSGPHWAEMGELLERVISVSGTTTSLSSPYLHCIPASSQQTWESHSLPKHTQAPFLPDPTGLPSFWLPF